MSNVVSAKSLKKLPDGRVVCMALQSQNELVLAGLRGHTIACQLPDRDPGGYWRVLDVSFYDGLGDGGSDEIGLILGPAG
jgi:hypothetical protein